MRKVYHVHAAGFLALSLSMRGRANNIWSKLSHDESTAWLLRWQIFYTQDGDERARLFLTLIGEWRYPDQSRQRRKKILANQRRYVVAISVAIIEKENVSAAATYECAGCIGPKPSLS